MRIGVLGLQGDVSEHIDVVNKTLEEEGIQGEVVCVKKPLEIDKLHAIIIPGGESTVIGRLAEKLNIAPKLRNFANRGLPIFGTCAGMVMLAKEVYHGGDKIEQPVLGLMDTRVIKNSLGRQRESFEVSLKIPKLDKKLCRAVFIRAPVVDKILSNKVEILATYKDKIVAVQQGSLVATAFHPELANDTRVFKYFVKLASG